MPRHDLNGTIKILGNEIPDKLEPKIRAGYIALTKLEGKTYEEFRKKVGSKPTPEDRPPAPIASSLSGSTATANAPITPFWSGGSRDPPRIWTGTEARGTRRRQP